MSTSLLPPQAISRRNFDDDLKPFVWFETKSYPPFKFVVTSTFRAARIRALEHENRSLRQDVEILKKVSAFFARGLA